MKDQVLHIEEEPAEETRHGRLNGVGPLTFNQEDASSSLVRASKGLVIFDPTIDVNKQPIEEILDALKWL